MCYIKYNIGYISVLWWNLFSVHTTTAFKKYISFYDGNIFWQKVSLQKLFNCILVIYYKQNCDIGLIMLFYETLYVKGVYIVVTNYVNLNFWKLSN
jgi:hypothetical protein